MAPPRLLQLSSLIRLAALQFHWFVLGFGAIASAVSAIAILAQPSALSFSNGTDAASDYRQFLRFRAGATEHVVASEPARVLAGISGEVSTRGENRIAGLDTSSERLDENVAPVVWNELSDAASCLTVKTKTGETFSFRVLGLKARTSDKTLSEGTANLAIAPCANNGAFVEKAVIEPDAASARKETVPARSL
jgi:hypothetical protein